MTRRMSMAWGAAAMTAAAFAAAAEPADPGEIFRIRDASSRTVVQYHRAIVAKGSEWVLADLAGPGKITYFYITPVSSLVLRIYWDGEKKASVEAPLADFFGAIGGVTVDYASAPMQIQHRCYMCYLPMPFSRRARVVLANDGDRDYRAAVAYGIDYERDVRYASEKSRLHCLWRRSNPVRPGAPPIADLIPAEACGGKNNIDTRHTLLEVSGHGQYVGNFLEVRTTNPHWWGEGITLFRVDGETMVHSPGTEDEYGSCWGFGASFSYPYCGYLSDGKGLHRMYRWYLANPVRFRRSLKVEIEDIRDFGPGADDFTSVAFWYEEQPR